MQPGDVTSQMWKFMKFHTRLSARKRLDNLSLIALIEVEYATQTIQRSFCERTSKRGYRVNIDQRDQTVIRDLMHSAKSTRNYRPSFPLRKKYSYLVVIPLGILLKKD